MYCVGMLPDKGANVEEDTKDDKDPMDWDRSIYLIMQDASKRVGTGS
jgi:hypothetical protein